MPEIFAASSSANPRVTPRLIAVDMDGTFLTDAKTFDTDRFERILPRLQAHGIYFVVASGNTYTKLTDYMKGFENRGIIYIAENGAYLADDSGELAVHPFKEADVPHVYEVLDTLPQIGVILCTTEGIFIPRNRQGAVTSIVQDYFAAQGQPVPQGLDPYSFVLMFYPSAERITDYSQVRGELIKISVQTVRADTYSVLETLQCELPPQVIPLASGFGAIDLVREGVNKAGGLRDLCERLNVHPQEVLAFGDGDNDREMLAFAGTGVAMGHASQALRAVADEVIGSHNDGAVLTYCEKLLDVLDAQGLPQAPRL